GLRRLPLRGEREREHGGGLLDGHEGELFVVGRMVEDRDVAEHLVGGQDRRDQAFARHAEVWKRRHLERSALGLDLAESALDLRVVEDAMRSALTEDRLLAV